MTDKQKNMLEHWKNKETEGMSEYEKEDLLEMITAYKIQQGILNP